MAHALKKQSTPLVDNGYQFYSLDQFGLSEEQFGYLQAQTHENQVKYTVLKGGDTGETASAEIYRLKHPANHNVNLDECINILESDNFKHFIARETLIPHFEIDRIQAHIYRPGDFLAKHIDSDSSDYLYTFVLILQSPEEGGEFVMFFGDEEYVVSPPAGTLIILDSSIPHEVRPVIKGERKTLCAFLRSC